MMGKTEFSKFSSERLLSYSVRHSNNDPRSTNSNRISVYKYIYCSGLWEIESEALEKALGYQSISYLIR